MILSGRKEITNDDNDDNDNDDDDSEAEQVIQRRLSSSVVSVSDDEGEFAAPPVTPHYMLQYTFSEDARAKREAHRASHLSLASQYKREGRLVMGGAMADMSGGLAVFRSRQDAQDFAESDPYVKHGVVTRHNIQEWNVVI